MKLRKTEGQWKRRRKLRRNKRKLPGKIERWRIKGNEEDEEELELDKWPTEES